MFQRFNRGKNYQPFLLSAGLFLLVVSCFFLVNNPCQAADQTAAEIDSAVDASDHFQAVSGESLDAVAIRILPNDEHYGIERWYREKGFSGSPQFLIVDGYEAIRDGRTVYVNATNVLGNIIHTNIYLISYNQDSKPGTTDALGQIIANWKFNNNLAAPGKCAITVAATSTCLVDGDCLGKGFCDSLKAKITRDVKRLSVLAEIKESLKNYQEKNGRFPDLPSGSYLPHLTISTWPSWQSTFGAQLGLDKSLVDPVNKLGQCPGFDAVTCWNKNLSTFAAKTNPLEFPNNSLVMAYQSENSGAKYSLCASMETHGSADSVNNYNTVDRLLSQGACSVKIDAPTSPVNPVFEAANLQGELGQEFSGFIKVANPSGNPLTWELSVISGASIFDGGVTLVDTNNPNQKKVYSRKALTVGAAEISIKVSDNRLGQQTKVFKITISKSKPKIEAENSDFILNNNRLSYSFYLNDDSVSDSGTPNYTLSYTRPSLSGGSSGILPSGLESKIEKIERGRFKVTIFQNSGRIDVPAGSNKVLNYRVTLNNSSGGSSVKDFIINLKQDKPVFDYQCEENVRKFGAYDCVVKLLNSKDHDITYSVAGLTGTNLSTSTDPSKVGTVRISGNALGVPPTPPTINRNFPCSTQSYQKFVSENDQENAATLQESFFKKYDDVLKSVILKAESQLESQQQEMQEENNILPSALLSPVLRVVTWAKNVLQIKEAFAESLGAPAANQQATKQQVCFQRTNPALDTNNTSGNLSVVTSEEEANYASRFDEYDETRNTSTGTSTPAPQSEFPITITATNEYGASATKSFVLKINSYCGDGIKQAPNQEKRGGIYNDGMEECDGVGGVALNVADSSASRQYSCTTGVGSTTPNPITSNNYCRATGGYCGDGICGSIDSTFTTDDHEVYDPGFNTNQYCHTDCSYCGDGIVQNNQGEQCDPGDPYSVQAYLGEYCNNRCKIARQLKILQVYAGNSSGAANTISVKAILNTLGNNPTDSSFRDNVAIVDNDTSGQVDYSVDTVSMNVFNSSPTSYLPVGNILEKYNLIVFGMGNNLSYPDPLARVLVENFIKNGGMVVFGGKTLNGTIFSDYSGTVPNTFSPVNATMIVHANNSREIFSLSTGNITVNTWQPSYLLKAANSACGPQCGGSACSAASSLLTNIFHIPTSPTYSWASVCNRVASIQLGHNNGAALKPEEYKIFGNLIYHLSTQISGDNF